ncbi:unnamed protein product [Cochlearia groenlandica]
MANNLQEPFTTYPTTPSQTNENHKVLDEENVWLHAEAIMHTSTFPMVLKAALELCVIDTIATVKNGVWLSPYEIALSLPIKPTNPEAPVLLDRMLRLLASHSIVKCRLVNTERVYAAEPVCKYFVKDSDGSGSLLSMFMLYQTHVFFETWTHLKDAILEGKNAFNYAHGMKAFEYMSKDQPFGDLFNRAMSESSTIIVKKVLEIYKGFEKVNVLVDLGGGIGTVLGLITSNHPHIKGINFDLAHVLANAPTYPNVEHIPGDMFIEVPKGDAIFMNRVLHDWTDQECVKILKNCWKSLPEKGKVIVVDMVAPIEPKDEHLSNIVYSMDMIMLTIPGGKERSFSEFENLAFETGFSRCEIICCVYSYFVIEFHK